MKDKKICSFYVSEVHLLTILMPYIDEKIKEKQENVLFLENNIPSEFVNLQDLDGLKEAILNLGKRFDKFDEANKILQDLEDKQSEVKNPHLTGNWSVRAAEFSLQIVVV